MLRTEAHDAGRGVGSYVKDNDYARWSQSVDGGPQGDWPQYMSILSALRSS